MQKTCSAKEEEEEKHRHTTPYKVIDDKRYSFVQ